MTAVGLDHVVYGVPDLLDGVRQIRDLTGVEPAPGGRHEHQGTANYLVGIGRGRYFEIIGPDPECEQPPRWFGLDRLRAARLLTWAIRVTDIDARVVAARAEGYDPGRVAVMSRRTGTGALLSWRLTPDTVRATGGVIPFLIDWGDSRHPTDGLLPQLRLTSFTVRTPNVRRARAQLATLGVVTDVEPGREPGLRCVLDGPAGQVTLH